MVSLMTARVSGNWDRSAKSMRLPMSRISSRTCCCMLLWEPNAHRTEVRVDAMVSWPAPKFVIAIFVKYCAVNSGRSWCSTMRSDSRSSRASLGGCALNADLHRVLTFRATSFLMLADVMIAAADVSYREKCAKVLRCLKGHAPDVTKSPAEGT